MRGVRITKRHMVILGLILGAFAFRWYRLDHLSLWLDEAFSLWFAQRPLLELWTSIPHFEPHPPLYYTLLKLWIFVFGTGESAVRSLSVLFGVLTVPVVYWIGVNVGGSRTGRWVGSIAALAVMLSPVLIEYSQEARPYAAQSLAFALALAGLAHILRFPDAASRPWLGTGGFGGGPPQDRWAGWAWLALIVGTAATLWMHFTSAIYVAALAFALLPCMIVTLRRDGRFLRNVLLGAAIVTTLCLPYLYYLSLTFQKVAADFWIVAFTWEQYLESLRYLFGVRALFRWQPIPDLVFASIALVGIARLLMSRRWPMGLLLVSATAVPIITLVVLGQIYHPVFVNRLVIGVTVPYAVAIAAGIGWLPNMWLRTIAAILLAAIWLVSAMNFYTLSSKEPWRDVVEYVAEGVRQNDIVVIVGGGAAIPFQYYRDRQPVAMRVKVIPAKFFADSAQLADDGSRSYFSAHHVPDLIATMRQYDRVWLVTRLRLSQRERPGHRLVRSTLEQSFPEQTRREFGGEIEVSLFQ
ncbi:MAG: mannosyltransferase [Alphaproteobacteria bacterium]|jgi:mannosyltransferase